MGCCCDVPWIYRYFPPASPDTPCLEDLAASVGRTAPWPNTVFLEDDFGHAIELVWFESSGVWAPAADVPAQEWQGEDRTCTGKVYTFGTNPDFAFQPSIILSCAPGVGLRLTTHTFYRAPENFLAFSKELAVSSGHQFDPIDINTSAITAVRQGGPGSAPRPIVCTMSGTNVAPDPTAFHLFE